MTGNPKILNSIKKNMYVMYNIYICMDIHL